MKTVLLLSLIPFAAIAQNPAVPSFSLFDLTPSTNYVLSVDGDNQITPSTIPFYSIKQGETLALTVRQTALGGFAGTTNLLANSFLPFQWSSPSITGSGTATLTLYAGGAAPGDYVTWIYENIPRSPLGIWVSVHVLPATTPSVYVGASTPPLPLANDTFTRITFGPWALFAGTQSPYIVTEAGGTNTAQFTVTASLLAGYAPGPIAFSTSGTLDPGLSVSTGPVTFFGNTTATLSPINAVAPLSTSAQQFLAGTINCDAYTAAAGAGAISCDQVTARGTYTSASTLAVISSTSSTSFASHSVQFAANVGGATSVAERASLITVIDSRKTVLTAGASLTNQSVAVGSSATYFVTFRAVNNSTTVVTPSVLGALPANVTVSFQPATLPASGGDANAVVTVGPSAAPGNYTLGFMGTVAGAFTSRSAAVGLTITP